jgi:hypothetical protein
MNTITTKRAPWLIRLVQRAYLRARIHWIEEDVAADTALRKTLPKRIREHERAAAAMRCELALLED